MAKMNNIRYSITNNESKIKSQTTEVFRVARSFFSSIKYEHAITHENLGLDVMVAGKSLLTALASYEQDLELHKDTRSQFKVSDSRSIQASIQTGVILASSNNDNLLNVDSRIVASKQTLILKLDEYNLKVKAYHQRTPLRWNNPIEFISL